jgi:hypothetical protein
MMLVCDRANPSGASAEMENVQFLLVKYDDEDAVRLVQRIKLGNGAAPQYLSPAVQNAQTRRNTADFMVRIIRSGNNTEAYAYTLDGEAEKLTETLRINRSFPSRMGVRIRATLEQDGFVDVTAISPDKTARVNLSEAMPALVEDALYQPNARPIPSMRNLSCVRNGWENEEFILGDDGLEARVGMTLVTPSRKQVVDVTAILRKDKNGKWAVADYLFEPFLPYRTW